MTQNSVLVIGHQNSGKSFILSSIFPEINNNTIKLETKYYECALEFVEKRFQELKLNTIFESNESIKTIDINEVKENSETIETNKLYITSNSIEESQAIIIIINLISQLDSVQEDLLKNRDSRFLILNSYLYEHTESEIQHCREWCLDRGVEFMKYSTNSNDEDHALHRLKEGLECTIWKNINMRKKAIGREPLSQKRVVSGEHLPQNIYNSENSFQLKDEDISLKNSINNLKLSNDSNKGIEVSEDTFPTDINPLPINQKSSELSHHNELNSIFENVGLNENNLDGFDNLLQQMVDLKTNGHKLDFEDRKGQATSLLLKLMKMLPESDDEEISDNENSSSNEDASDYE